jgi:bifunctional DNA-binding transcriptional regulator/antitoxin component of YhaV-PrlF toxin-antitoxin module
METEHTEQTWQASIDSSGRILLPVELRKLFDAQPGNSLIWIKDERGLRLQRLADSLKGIQSYYQNLSPTDVSWSDELIKRRREESRHE